MNIERRRRWVEEIEREINRLNWGGYSRHKRLLSLLRRVRRCPSCWRGALTDVDSGGPDRCMTCGGTGRI